MKHYLLHPLFKVSIFPIRAAKLGSSSVGVFESFQVTVVSQDDLLVCRYIISAHVVTCDTAT